MKTVQCPKCATLLKFQPQASAVRIKCPKCATMLKVGGQSPQGGKTPKPASSPKQASGGGATSKPKTPAKKRAAGAPRAAAPKSAAPKTLAADPLAADPLAADPLGAPAASGGFDFGNLDLPDPIIPTAPVAGDPLAMPAAGFPASPTLQPKVVPSAKSAAGKQPGKKSPATKSAGSANKKLLWVGLAVAGLLVLAVGGGLAFLLLGSSGTSTAQSDAPTEESVSPQSSGSSGAAAASDSAPSTEGTQAPSDSSPPEPPFEQSPRESAPFGSTPPAADAAQETAPPTNGSATTFDPSTLKTHSVGNVSASFPSGKVLESLPTGIEGHAVRSDLTKSTMYIAVGKIDKEIADRDKIIRQVQRLVMADVYPGDPCQRSNRQGIEGRLSSGLVLPSMELEIYKSGSEVVIIGWARPQHEVDLFTPIILQQKLPPVESDPELVEAEKAAFLDSVQIK